MTGVERADGTETRPPLSTEEDRWNGILPLPRSARQTEGFRPVRGLDAGGGRRLGWERKLSIRKEKGPTTVSR
ncbi:MAG: hypothetical protein JNK54_10800 [Elusimicrobia bacterium]|nr:hypothetical protein [Elusimicrobiota bacterium]